MSLGAWQEIATELVQSYTVVRCDLRGQLLSPGPPPNDIGGHAVDVADLLRTLGLGPAHVLATSFGAAVALLLAVRFPGLVRSLCLVAATDRFDGEMASEVERWRLACREAVASGDKGRLVDVMHPVAFSAAFRAEHAEQLGRRREQMQSLPDRWFEDLDALMASTGPADLGSQLAKVRCPVLVVAAELDRFIPLERTRTLAHLIPGAEFQNLEGAGHAAVLERPYEVARLVKGFLRRRSSE
jgi:pimeloyl-ACP methyl ester carboxylesterase